jgi:hypothetical protein
MACPSERRSENSRDKRDTGTDSRQRSRQQPSRTSSSPQPIIERISGRFAAFAAGFAAKFRVIVALEVVTEARCGFVAPPAAPLSPVTANLQRSDPAPAVRPIRITPDDTMETWQI